jgi:hypothetical protein
LLAHPVFPQIVVLAAMAAERPRWGWIAEPLVRQRNATTFLFERVETPLADRWTRIIGGVAAAWAAALGGRASSRWRRRMRRLHAVWGSAADVRATKLYERPTPRAQARLALACLGAFWPTRAYWREVLPASVMPVGLTRVRYGARRRRLRGGPEAARLTMCGSLPARIIAGSVAHVPVDVGNAGRRTILPDGPSAVTIGQIWRTAAGHEVGADELGLNELAALAQSLPHAVRPRRSNRVDVALYAPLRVGSYRVELDAHQHGYGWLGQLKRSQPISGSIEVVEGRTRAVGAGDGVG